MKSNWLGKLQALFNEQKESNMRLIKVRVQNYRSIIDSGDIEIEKLKTIIVGPNEAGKTVLLKAIQQLKKPAEIPGFDHLRDYPRALLNDIQTGKIKPSDIKVVTGYFELEDEDKKLIPIEFQNCQYKLYRNLDNKSYHSLVGGPERVYFIDLKKDFIRMITHMDKQYNEEDENKPSLSFKKLTDQWSEYKDISGDTYKVLKEWFEKYYQYVEEDNETEENRFTKILEKIEK